MNLPCACGALSLVQEKGHEGGTHTVEARKLEHHYPHALKVKYRESQHESSYIHVPTFWGSLYMGEKGLGI